MPRGRTREGVDGPLAALPVRGLTGARSSGPEGQNEEKEDLSTGAIMVGSPKYRHGGSSLEHC